MRLACRLGDQSIQGALRKNVLEDVEDLLFSASVRGLVCLSSSSFAEREAALSFLKAASDRVSKEEKRHVVIQAIADITRVHLARS